MGNGLQLRRGGYVYVTEFTAEELREIAHAFGPRDGAYQEFLDWADEVDEANERASNG